MFKWDAAANRVYEQIRCVREEYESAHADAPGTMLVVRELLATAQATRTLLGQGELLRFPEWRQTELDTWLEQMKPWSVTELENFRIRLSNDVEDAATKNRPRLRSETPASLGDFVLEILWAKERPTLTERERELLTQWVNSPTRPICITDSGEEWAGNEAVEKRRIKRLLEDDAAAASLGAKRRKEKSGGVVAERPYIFNLPAHFRHTLFAAVELLDVLQRERTAACNAARKSKGVVKQVEDGIDVRTALLLRLDANHETGLAVRDLPEPLRTPELLTVLDADGLIEFGRRNHCYVGGGDAPELRIERGWNFRSVTGRDCKPMADILTEYLSDGVEPPLHVRLTAKGRIDAARMKLAAASSPAVAGQGKAKAAGESKVEGTGAGAVGDTAIETKAAKQYPSPQTYGRDKWIYENITSHTCHALSQKLKNRAKQNKWEIISSRNGFKKAADRYADFHTLERRRFATK